MSLPNGEVIEYIDPLGRRIGKKINGAITEKYLWRGRTKLLAVFDGADILLMRFQYADARMPLAMTKGDQTYYLTYDQVGSLRLVTDSTGNTIKRLDYDSFGNILFDTNPSFTLPFSFAGGLHDPDTSLVRFGYRDYDPDVGRWTAKDPILFTGGDTDLYGYCLNDPVDISDPNGLMAPNAASAIVGAAIGGATAFMTAYYSGARGWNLLAQAAVRALWGAAACFVLQPWLGAARNGLAGALGNASSQAVSQALDPCVKHFDIKWGSVAISGIAGLMGGETSATMTTLFYVENTAYNAAAMATVSGGGTAFYDFSGQSIFGYIR